MRSLIVVLMLAPVAAPAVAQELLGDRLRINGFASQAYLRSTGNDYLVEASRDGSFQFTELGLTVNARIDDRLRVGGQILARDLGLEGNLAAKLDWGFGEYRIHDALGIRVGKVKLPIGLYNEERDLDVLRPMAFLPQGVYDELTRDFLTAGVGAGAFGNVPLGDAGDLDYSVFVGEIEVSDAITFVRLQKRFISAGSLAVLGVPATDYDWNSGTAIAARLDYNTPLSGLRLGASYADVSGEWELGAYGERFSDALAPLGIPGTVSGAFRDNWVFSGEYLSQRVDLRAELKRVHLEAATFGNVVEEKDTEAWYVMGTVRIPGLEGVAVTGVLDHFTRDRDGEHDPANGHHNERKDLGIGLMWEVAQGFRLKAEYHDVTGAASVFDTWAELNRQQGLTDEWGYFILKTSFAF